jgi:hypothetical protein
LETLAKLAGGVAVNAGAGGMPPGGGGMGGMDF